MACELCGSTKKVEQHHIVPRWLGGSDAPTNIMPLCRKCHVELHKKNGTFRVAGSIGGKLTVERKPLNFLFNLKQYKDSPEKRKEYVLAKKPHLFNEYLLLEESHESLDYTA